MPPSEPLTASANLMSGPGFTCPVADVVWVRIAGGTADDRKDAATRACEAIGTTDPPRGRHHA